MPRAHRAFLKILVLIEDSLQASNALKALYNLPPRAPAPAALVSIKPSHRKYAAWRVAVYYFGMNS
jgi:hypothetical protein